MEQLGLENPAAAKIRLLWTDLGIFFGNTVTEFQLFLWGHPSSNHDGRVVRIKTAAIDTEDMVASEETKLSSTRGRTHASSSEPQPQQSPQKPPQQPTAAHLLTRSSPDSMSGTSAVPLQKLPSTAVASSPGLPEPEPLLWLLLCMDNERWPYIKDPVDVTNIGYDQGLFTIIRRRHVARRKPGIKWSLGLWRPLLISYVKVSKSHIFLSANPNLFTRLLFHLGQRLMPTVAVHFARR